MGVLYQAVNSQAELKRSIVIDRLRALKITVDRQGHSIESLGYEELKRELAIASFRN